MRFLYSLLQSVFNSVLPIIGLLSPKLSLFVNGRKRVYHTLDLHFPSDKQTIWVHCASLGEYEQGVPVMEALKKEYPAYRILVTFFSPSGYEVKKDHGLPDIVTYIPIDTVQNVRRFLDLTQPEIAIFIKYEFWPNYIFELEKRNIPLLMVSASFRESQVFFKWYGGFMRMALRTVNHFFVQDKASVALLQNISLLNATHSGDTRFDRVSHQIEMNNQIDFIEEFIANRTCVVLGSTWQEDEAVFIPYINTTKSDVCFIIAPHEIKEHKISALQQRLQCDTVTFSDRSEKKLSDYKVFVLDTVGYLSRAYSYADIAYVGGAMGTSGLHNILEPATFGVPIVIGHNFEKFREAIQLQKLAGLFSISTAEEFTSIIDKLVTNVKFREKTGMITGHFINSNTGATSLVMDYVGKVLLEVAKNKD